MEFQEYPKSLYAEGWKDLSKSVVVNDEKEETEARKNGFCGLNEENKKAK